MIDRGGINAAARGGKPESASQADLAGNLGRDLAEAEAAIATAKQTYYDALKPASSGAKGAGTGGKELSGC